MVHTPNIGVLATFLLQLWDDKLTKDKVLLNCKHPSWLTLLRCWVSGLGHWDGSVGERTRPSRRASKERRRLQLTFRRWFSGATCWNQQLWSKQHYIPRNDSKYYCYNAIKTKTFGLFSNDRHGDGGKWQGIGVNQLLCKWVNCRNEGLMTCACHWLRWMWGMCQLPHENRSICPLVRDTTVNT